MTDMWGCTWRARCWCSWFVRTADQCVHAKDTAGLYPTFRNLHLLALHNWSYFCLYTPVANDSANHAFLFQFFQSPHATLRKLALGCINQYIVVMPSVIDLPHIVNLSFSMLLTDCLVPHRPYICLWISICRDYLTLRRTPQQMFGNWYSPYMYFLWCQLVCKRIAHYGVLLIC